MIYKVFLLIYFYNFLLFNGTFALLFNRELEIVCWYLSNDGRSVGFHQVSNLQEWAPQVNFCAGRQRIYAGGEEPSIVAQVQRWGFCSIVKYRVRPDICERLPDMTTAKKQPWIPALCSSETKHTYLVHHHRLNCCVFGRRWGAVLRRSRHFVHGHRQGQVGEDVDWKVIAEVVVGFAVRQDWRRHFYSCPEQWTKKQQTIRNKKSKARSFQPMNLPAVFTLHRNVTGFP